MSPEQFFTQGETGCADLKDVTKVDQFETMLWQNMTGRKSIYGATFHKSYFPKRHQLFNLNLLNN